MYCRMNSTITCLITFHFFIKLSESHIFSQDKIYFAHAYLLDGGGRFEDKLFLILEAVELLIFLLNSPKAIIFIQDKIYFIHQHDISY